MDRFGKGASERNAGERNAGDFLPTPLAGEGRARMKSPCAKPTRLYSGFTPAARMISSHTLISPA
jgi:hypothetical protein